MAAWVSAHFNVGTDSTEIKERSLVLLASSSGQW